MAKAQNGQKNLKLNKGMYFTF